MSDGGSEFGGGMIRRRRLPEGPLQEVWRGLDARSDRHELTRGEAGRGARDPEECWMRLSGSQRASKASEARKQCRAGSSGIGALRKTT